MKITAKLRACFHKLLHRRKKDVPLPIPPMNIIAVSFLGTDDGFKINCEVDKIVRVHRTHDGWHCLTLKGFSFNERDFGRKFFYTLEEARDYITGRLERNI